MDKAVESYRLIEQDINGLFVLTWYLELVQTGEISRATPGDAQP